MTLKTFIVAITGINHYGVMSTEDMEFVAKNADEAKKAARAYMRDVAGWGRHDGKLTYRARRGED